MTTALDLLSQALSDIGVLGEGQQPSAFEYNLSFSTLNQMISQWARKRWLVYELVTTGLTSTGAQSYTVGPGGDYALAIRPPRIESAFVRQLIPTVPNQVDYPLEIITSREDYNRISLKSLQSFPYALFYSPGYPLGTAFPWPIPQAQTYSVFITTMAVLPRFANQAANVNLPEEYEAALRYNLAVRLMGGTFDVPDKPALRALAADSLNTIRGANTAISTLGMPELSRSGGTYNIYADRDT